MKTILGFMGEDHDRLDDIFKKFKNIKKTDEQQAGIIFHEFMTGLQRHIVWEEEILFPIFENKTGMHESGPTAVMRMEHRIIKDFMEKIQHNLDKHIETDNLEQELIEVLTDHNGKEELILYPWIDNSADEVEISEAFAKMEGHS